MIILAIGDFHGKFPDKLKYKLKKEKYDLIISPGDYCGNKELGKLFFKYSYGKDITLEQAIGKRRSRNLDKLNFLAGKAVINKLKELNKPIIGVTGNWDPTGIPDIGGKIINENFVREFNEFIKNKIKIIDFKNLNYKGYNFAGYPRSSYPGKITKEKEKILELEEIKKADILVKKIKLNYLNKKLLKKFPNLSKDNILISHNCPYNTKLDIIKDKKAVKEVRGEHYGSCLTRDLIEKLKPKLVVCGHMHENQGMQKIGSTYIVNPGAAIDCKAAIIELDDIRKNVKKVRFLK